MYLGIQHHNLNCERAKINLQFRIRFSNITLPEKMAINLPASEADNRTSLPEMMTEKAEKYRREIFRKFRTFILLDGNILMGV